MKSNVDLTLDKIFSNPPRAKILLNEIAAPKGKYPWSFSKRYSHYGPVLTGNASERKEARLCELEIQMICGEEVPYCYRCGKRIIPWQRKGNLCTECDAKIMPDIHLGFEVPEDWIFNTDDRVVLELNYQVRRKTPAFRHGDIRRNRNSERRPSCESDKDLSV